MTFRDRWRTVGAARRDGLAQLRAACSAMREAVVAPVRALADVGAEVARFVWQTTRWALSTSWGLLFSLALLAFFLGGTLVRYLLQLLRLG